MVGQMSTGKIFNILRKSWKQTIWYVLKWKTAENSGTGFKKFSKKYLKRIRSDLVIYEDIKE